MVYENKNEMKGLIFFCSLFIYEQFSSNDDELTFICTRRRKNSTLGPLNFLHISAHFLDHFHYLFDLLKELIVHFVVWHFNFEFIFFVGRLFERERKLDFFLNKKKRKRKTFSNINKNWMISLGEIN